MSDGAVLIWILINLLIIIGAVVIYFIPTSTAFRRKHPSRWLIFVLNLIFGATVIGWFGALIWALMAPSKSSGSRLNIFENDAINVRLAGGEIRPFAEDQPRLSAPPTSPNEAPAALASATDMNELLAKLKKLRDDGMIDADEYRRLRQPYLDQLLR